MPKLNENTHTHRDHHLQRFIYLSVSLSDKNTYIETEDKHTLVRTHTVKSKHTQSNVVWMSPDRGMSRESSASGDSSVCVCVCARACACVNNDMDRRKNKQRMQSDGGKNNRRMARERKKWDRESARQRHKKRGRQRRWQREGGIDRVKRGGNEREGESLPEDSATSLGMPG